MAKNINKSALGHYMDYEIIYQKDKKSLYEKGFSSALSVFPYSSMNCVVLATGCLTPERYAAYRTILCLYISNPSLYKWYWYRRELMGEHWAYDGNYMKYVPSKDIKLFKKECQRLINILDKNFKTKYSIK
jgi:hypothetical protein